MTKVVKGIPRRAFNNINTNECIILIDDVDTGHTEAVQMLFNPAVVSYKELLTVLFDRMDPTTLNR